MRMVFMGSAEFGIGAFDALREAGHDIVAVVTTPPAPRGRGRKLTDSPIALHSRAAGISPVLTPQDLGSVSFVDTLTQLSAEFFVVVAFRILPPAVFTIPPMGTVNIHASLLPRYRGAAPIQRAIEAGEKETGVTIFRIDQGIDTGEIVAQEKLTIGPDETTPLLYDRLAELGARTIVDVVGRMENGKIEHYEQDHGQACGAPKLRKQEGLIDWSLPAGNIYNKIRAFKPFPGTFTLFEGKPLGIDWAVPTDQQSQKSPGSICNVGSTGFDVQSGDVLMHVERVKPDGGRIMESASFVRGRRVEEGSVLG